MSQHTTVHSLARASEWKKNILSFKLCAEAEKNFQTPCRLLQNFMRSYCKTSICLVNRGPIRFCPCVIKMNSFAQFQNFFQQWMLEMLWILPNANSESWDRNFYALLLYRCSPLLCYFYYLYEMKKSVLLEIHRHFVCILFSLLTLVVLGLEYSRWRRSVACLMMPWLLASPGHQ